MDKQRGTYRNISRIGGCHHDRGKTQRNQPQQEEPQEKKKFSEKQKLIIYSEIMKPKFDG